MTSKYRRLSSCGTALIPGTLHRHVLGRMLLLEASTKECFTHGSAIRRSVSFMILFGNAAMMAWRANPTSYSLPSASKALDLVSQVASQVRVGSENGRRYCCEGMDCRGEAGAWRCSERRIGWSRNNSLAAEAGIRSHAGQPIYASNTKQWRVTRVLFTSR